MDVAHEFERNHVLRNGFWISFRYGIISLAGFLVSVIFARMSDKETYGSFQYVLSIVALVSVFSLPGLSFSALKGVVHGAFGSVAQAVRMGLRMSFIGSILLFCIGIFQWHFSSEEVAKSFFVAAFFFPFFYGFNPWYTYYEGQKIFRSVALRSISISFLWVLALLLLLFFRANLLLIVSVYFAVTSIFSVWFFFEAKSRYHNEKEDFSFRYALAVTGQKFFLNLTENLPPILIGAVFGYSLVAVFQIAYFPLSALSAYFGALIALKLPDFFKEFRDTESFQGIFFWNSLSGIASFLFMGVFLFVCFPFVYGSEYSDSLSLAWILSPLVFFFPFKTYFTNFFSAQEKNAFVILAFAFANTLALMVGGILFLQGLSFFVITAFYLYVFNLSLLVFLGVNYRRFLKDMEKGARSALPL